MDVIAACAFGIEANSFDDPNSEIILAGKAWFEDMMWFMMNSIQGFQKLFEGYSSGPYEKLYNIPKSVQSEREKSGTGSGDFMYRLIELQKQVKRGEITGISEDQVTGQGIVFFAAGFETTSNTLGTLCYNLVKNPEAMAKLEEEIETTLVEHDGKVNQETVSEMPYLEACIKETLRIFSPAARNDRRCNEDWSYNNINIPRGTCIGIPIHAIHHNPKYFPDPEVFKPERFLKENSDELIPGAFVSFGIGPRACIGERFALIEMKIAMTKLLQNFQLEMAEETKLANNIGELFMFAY